MERPYVVCHMLTSLDGKIDGSWFTHSDCTSALKAYSNLRSEFDCQATLYGTTTMVGGYSDGLVGKLSYSEIIYPKEDYLVVSDFNNYIVALDSKGILGWNKGYVEKKNRPKAHVIEVLTECVSSDYLVYLRERGVSYIFAGTDTIDCFLLLHKLKTLFSIERLMLAGGGITNWSFAKDGLIDELSIVVAPVADGNIKAVSVFEDWTGNNQVVSMRLKTVSCLDGNAIWMRYLME